MLLKKSEKNGIVTAHYDSSNVIASEWDGTNLTVIFKHGGSYTYNNVSNTDYVRFELAESQGSILNSKIKGYSFIKNDNVDVDTFLREIKDTKIEELRKFEEGIVDHMRVIISSYESNPILTRPSLDKLTEMLVKYSEMEG